jgi:hypothetical protein|uniref:Uncharacterized protein n=1 Tax=Siphoviridae sp. ctGuJ10 TaxID=2825418 RepID=A0A8S5PV07_9CAUD|nr:MAG TPA: hypothetical protein [Siphoviridae sp. ctGuJ10]
MKSNKLNYAICISTLLLSLLSIILVPLSLHSQVLLINSNTLSIKTSFGGEAFIPLVILIIGCFVLSFRDADELFFRKGPKAMIVVILTLNFIVVITTKIVF